LFDGPLNQPQKMPQFNNNIVHAVVSKGKVINLPDANKWDDKNLAPEGTFPESILCVPMFNKSGGVIGVIEALYKEGDNFSHDDEDWLKALAAIAAGSIEQAQSYAEIETFVDKTLETLAQTIDKRDPLTAGHSMRVTKYSLLIGQLFGLSKNDLEVLRYAAMMHDYGKIGVPEAILWKNGRLTPQEYALVQTHAKITYDLLINLPFTKHLVDVPYVASCHHEKLDGSGYYRGLKGDEIPLLARIITVADVFDALTSVRHYRNRMDISRVAEIMETGRGNHFDSKFVDIFFKSPCHKILQIMESEHKQDQPNNLKAFCQITLGRLIELCQGASPQPDEVGLPELFTQIYNEGLPPNYLALD
jgi:HD-GYP domain-containing protein (c-di-GMP phosphodiesterase class II)